MVGIIMPYGRNEVTSAALRLADLVEGTGVPVRLVACGVHESRVHPHWDRRVRSGRQEQLYFSLSGARRGRPVAKAEMCRAYVHFACDRRAFEAVALVADRAPQILVPNWTVLTPDDDSLIRQYDRVVCPSKAAYLAIKRDLYGDGKVPVDRLSWVRWDAGVAGVSREGTVADNLVRVLFFCDHATVDYCAPVVVRLADEVLAKYPKTQVTLASTKSWAKGDRRAIARLRSRWANRFSTRPLVDFQAQMTEIHAHDWVVCPAVQGAFGQIVARAAACGVPVVAHDIEPFSELITVEHNGLLVDCQIAYGQARAPQAVPDMGRWLAALDQAFRNNTLLFRMQTKAWKVTAVRTAFEKFWATVLGL